MSPQIQISPWTQKLFDANSKDFHIISYTYHKIILLDSFEALRNRKSNNPSHKVRPKSGNIFPKRMATKKKKEVTILKFKRNPLRNRLQQLQIKRSAHRNKLAGELFSFHHMRHYQPWAFKYWKQKKVLLLYQKDFALHFTVTSLKWPMSPQTPGSVTGKKNFFLSSSHYCSKLIHPINSWKLTTASSNAFKYSHKVNTKALQPLLNPYAKSTNRIVKGWCPANQGKK